MVVILLQLMTPSYMTMSKCVQLSSYKFSYNYVATSHMNFFNFSYHSYLITILFIAIINTNVEIIIICGELFEAYIVRTRIQ